MRRRRRPPLDRRQRCICKDSTRSPLGTAHPLGRIAARVRVCVPDADGSERNGAVRHDDDDDDALPQVPP